MQNAKRSRHRRAGIVCIAVLLLCAALPAYAKAKEPVADTKAAAPDYLRLINWDNPYEEDAYTLVRLDSVIPKGLVEMRGNHLVEKTAGEAACLLFEAAALEHTGKFVIDSAYRSVKTQARYWDKRIKKNPSYGDDPFTAPVKVMPGGMSEHATGLALDILAKSHKKADAAYGQTEEAIWLREHAHLYGFILRYPEGKEHITGVIYEPWHVRYVGVEDATAMYESGLCLEEYLLQKAAAQQEKAQAPRRHRQAKG